MPFWAAPVLRLLALAVTALAVGLTVDDVAGWVLLAAGLASAYAYHLIQLARLTRWLDRSRSEKAGAVPESSGEWGDAFAALYRLRREEQAGRERLSDSLERLSQAAEALPDGIVLLDTMMRIEWCNSMATRHLGIDAVRDRGMPITHLVREPAFAAYVKEAGNVDPVVLKNASPPVRTLSLSMIPFAESGRLLISRDITAIELADTVRRDFVANVSHELRTPLTVIVGFLEGLAAGNVVDVPGLARQHALMHEQALRMERLVEDLLTLSRLENDTEPPREDTVDMPGLLESLREEASALSGGKHLVELGEVSAGSVRGSTDELRSAFGNLASNAVRYTPEGGKLVFNWRIEDGCPVFSVEDNGIGIPPEHIPRLTERFYRVDNGRSTATGGTGLGLAIVKHVLARHQGWLTIRSEIGRGSVFSAHLPRQRLVATHPCA
ncbi:MAG: phosphate regulon sensor histidine kinase PhoR [Sulfuritalea sp.]|jgi:two-component system phosphate regulon sensor histidine kinase PhoR|nr:phosphate regulon sensor histidine kinase PhoR [Sulfuritalea sp.]